MKTMVTFGSILHLLYNDIEEICCHMPMTEENLEGRVVLQKTSLLKLRQYTCMILLLHLVCRSLH